MLSTGRRTLMTLTDLARASPTQVLDHPNVSLFLLRDRAQIIIGTLVTFPVHHVGSSCFLSALPRKWFKISQLLSEFSTQIFLLVSNLIADWSNCRDVIPHGLSNDAHIPGAAK